MTDESTVPAPAPRILLHRSAPEFHRALLEASRAATAGLADPVVTELVNLRASQINGCAFCLDRHAADARANGEREHRLDTLAAWRETPYFTARERAALALTESVTLLADTHVPDEVFDEAAEHFAEAELAHLIGLISAINALNRVGVTSRLTPRR
ncbi:MULTISPECIES: carboxymuconolactone decarboxylase family protein [Kitasatospora]|uniref:carboxymuconolactone decarboxylase family protein n=1 Tax=Kitasatospora TaxID=2063 RepID=UPI000689B49C|nr:MULTISPECIES: carboxymuconolactone decarboxylase family protein [unclassified Kitasatospora]WAL73203.1 carboxymuconolactone decarboxylase family protein [Kitasatospora sp. YST-16]WNW39256.1 carboxymuconolactone decarboxylase family protein [Streptomyces sp. Li-HN-5-13]